MLLTALILAVCTAGYLLFAVAFGMFLGFSDKRAKQEALQRFFKEE